MSDLIAKIGLAVTAFKGRQQDITGVSLRAYKDLFAAANAALLSSGVQDLIRQSYREMITANSPKTSLLAAVAQHHTEIIAGCRVLTQDEDILRALTDAANAATMEAFRLIYPNTSESPARTLRRSKAKGVSPPEQSVRKRRPRSTKRS
jgi:hypothetical protein